MTSSMPSRPSLQRNHFTTSSVPHTDYAHEKSLARSIPGFSPTSLSPTYQQQQQNSRKASFGQDMQPRRPAFGQDMLRTESADSHRSLKSKHSRKELKEMARSGSPLVSTFHQSSSSTKHKYTRSWEDDGNKDDDDARSISSFTCSFADEFDAKYKARLEYGNEESATRQRFLDAVFRKLTQKTGIHKRESRAWAAVEQTIREEQSSSDLSSQSKSSKAKMHFLDLSNYISPVPSSTAQGADSNITPRQADIQSFKALSPVQPPSNKSRPLLRSRRSADNIGETRRLQREEWSGAQGAATTESIPSRVLSLNAPAGMSHALMARSGQSDLPSPVPSLPDWARSSNLSLHQKGGQNRSVDLNKPNDGVPSAHRAVDMGRAASHDASMYVQRNAVRPAVMARGVSGPVRGTASEQQQHFAVPPHLQLRAQRLPRSLASPMTPISPHWPRSAPHTLPDECVSPLSSNSPNLIHRSSIGSTTSDSASSGMSSVPQTPISRKVALPAFSQEDGEIEMTVDDEEDLLSAVGQYALDNGKNSGMMVDKFGRLPLTMTPRPMQRRSPHVATLFETTSSETLHRSNHSKSSSNGSVGSASSIHVAEKEGNSTVKANKIQTRPRASTTSSTQSPIRPRTSPGAVESLGPVSPESPSRSSSLQQKGSRRAQVVKHRESTLSTTSTNSSQSNSESLLSYTRGSPSSTTSSPTASPSNAATRSSTASRHPSSSSASSIHRPRTTSKAEDWASSIGRRFAKGVNSTAVVATPPMPLLPSSDRSHPQEV